MAVKHSAGLYRTKYVGHLITIALIFYFIAVFLAGELDILIGSAIASALILFRLSKRIMVFEDEEFYYDGWVSRKVVRYNQVLKVERSLDLYWPINRMHGPSEYRITTSSGQFWVNLVWFNSKAAREFHSRVAKRHA